MAPGESARGARAAALRVDDTRIVLGYGLLPMCNAANGSGLPQQIKGLRRQLANEIGFVMPAVRIQDNMQLPAQGYLIRIKEIEVGRGEVGRGEAGLVLPLAAHGASCAVPATLRYAAISGSTDEIGVHPWATTILPLSGVTV